jgi:hypothetical protein
MKMELAISAESLAPFLRQRVRYFSDRRFNYPAAVVVGPITHQARRNLLVSLHGAAR